MAKKPSISIIVTTYNNQDTIEACLKSIKNQSFKDFELIVVDEKSSDKTAEIARKYADKVIIGGKERCQKRNLGAENARADYLFFVDSDMKLGKHMLEEIRKESNSRTLLMIPEISFGKGYWAKCKAFERSFYTGGDLSQGVRGYPKKIFFKSNGFDEVVLGVEDLDLFHRIIKANKNLRVIEIKDTILHNEGKLKYFQIIRRMLYYSRSFKEYKARHPEIFKKQISVMKYLRKWEKFARHPILSLGFILIKGGEAATVLYSIKKSSN